MIRYYEVPGYAHTTSSTFNVRWDPWSAMEDWAEQGIDPADKLVIADATGRKGRSRPLCEYPKWAKYVGGDVNRASSRSEEHTSELQSLMRISYAVFCLKKKHKQNKTKTT